MYYNKTVILVLLFFSFRSMALFSAPGDTTVVQTFSYEDGRQAPWTCKKGKFLFPDGNKQYEKVLMYYSLKCDPSQSPGCGEWDYIFHTELLDPTDITPEGDTIYTTWKLGTYVTPYGNNLNMGEGWTWVYDVSDFIHLLKDSVILQDCNFQELLDIKFIFIEGVPPRDVTEIRYIWNDTYNLSDFDEVVKDTTVALSPDVKQLKVRSTVTGHDFDNPTTCAEFCHNIHKFKVNGQTISEWDILRECADNPLYPQGGTWLYDRAGWCPGTPGDIKEFELTHFINNNTINFDYDIVHDLYGIYRTYIYMVTYSEINHDDDVSAELIIAPSDNPLQKRYNPTCGEPIIVIKNIGANELRQVNIEYGFEEGTLYHFLWQGNLAFLETDTVVLPSPNWGEVNDNSAVFKFKLLNPNGYPDPTPYNNSIESCFKPVPIVQANRFRFQFKTNHAPEETTWKLYNMNDVILYQNESNMEANTLYITDIELEDGGYRLVIDDAGDDGLKFWANMSPYGDGTSGSAILKRENGENWNNFYIFQSDFGKSIQFYFIANQYIYSTGVHTLPEKNNLRIFPNPANNALTLDLNDIQGSRLVVDIYDLWGRRLLHKDVIALQSNKIDIFQLTNGMYIAILTDQGTFVGSEKFVVGR